ncbi:MULTISPECIES: hypothetical protein [unclassified Lentimonas]|uniref:hypothetical protein n=1 Tax=unclassified Lentimonas TaxID=2630993 RepID=UPI001328D83F|nr:MULTISPECIES: hypothetical protein [unclassified Lentimonas]CAA6695991.1 Unannotated [Lentimonas sp. CC19]
MPGLNGASRQTGAIVLAMPLVLWLTIISESIVCICAHRFGAARSIRNTASPSPEDLRRGF